MREVRNKMRQEMLQTRNQLTMDEVKQNSLAICEKLTELLDIQNARTIMGFSAFGNEVILMPYLETLMEEKTILLPRVEKGGEMVAVEFTGWDNMGSGPFGIKEPLGEAFDVSQIDVVIVPGLIFDPNGYRIGYGKGYYDRFLKKLRKDAFFCGVCYDFQVLKDTYPEDKDVPVHWIVTEKSEVVVNWDHF